MEGVLGDGIRIGFENFGVVGVGERCWVEGIEEVGRSGGWVDGRDGVGQNPLSKQVSSFLLLMVARNPTRNPTEWCT